MKRTLLPLVLLATVCLASLGAAAPAPDRLDRFRQIAATRLGFTQIIDEGGGSEVSKEVFALLDEEIVESLQSGSVFTSAEFLQDRLDAFAEAWGGASLRVVPLGRLVIGAFQLGDASAVNTVRVYGRLRDEAGLLSAMYREGRPAVHPLPAGPGGAVQFLVAWEAAPSGRGTRALRLDQVRHEGEAARVVWSTASLFPEGLLARGFALRGGEVRIRYEVRYPGFTPGCEGQTEQEDVYRLAPGTGSFVRVGRQQHNGWHQNLWSIVARFFDALAGGDRATLASLVPDAQLRSRLPATLHHEPACDAVEGVPPDTVSIAASAERRPWQLTFQRTTGRWRLTAAAPVLQ